MTNIIVMMSLNTYKHTVHQLLLNIPFYLAIDIYLS
jgi:hypothetical protein